MMLEILQQITAAMLADSTLTAIVPTANITVGQVDILSETNTANAVDTILFPSINVHTASEALRTVPSNARDTLVQLDIWSNNSALEAQNIYERLLVTLNYTNIDFGAAHIFWSVPSSVEEFYHDNRRLWRIAITWSYWSVKP